MPYDAKQKLPKGSRGAAHAQRSKLQVQVLLVSVHGKIEEDYSIARAGGFYAISDSAVIPLPDSLPVARQH